MKGGSPMTFELRANWECYNPDKEDYEILVINKRKEILPEAVAGCFVLFLIMLGLALFYPIRWITEGIIFAQIPQKIGLLAKKIKQLDQEYFYGKDMTK